MSTWQLLCFSELFLLLILWTMKSHKLSLINKSILIGVEPSFTCLIEGDRPYFQNFINKALPKFWCRLMLIKRSLFERTVSMASEFYNLQSYFLWQSWLSGMFDLIRAWFQQVIIIQFWIWFCLTEQDELSFPQTAPLDNSELDLLLVEPAWTRKPSERAGFSPGTPPKLKSVIVYEEIIIKR